MQELPATPPPSDPLPEDLPAADAVAPAAVSAEVPADVPADMDAVTEAVTEVAIDAAVGAVAEAQTAPREPGIADLAPAACAALLAERFPALFGIGRPLPIKLRIQADIQQRAPGLFNKKSLSIFLHRHTTSTAYIKALLASPQRFDLDGQPSGEIAQEHRDAAVTEIERRLAIVQARRVAERDAQRQAAMARREPPAATANAAAAGEATAHPERSMQPPQPPRPERQVRQVRQERPPRPPGADQQQRPARADRPPRADQAPRAERPPRAEAARPQPAPPEAIAAAPALPLTPDQIADNEARRSRAALLRSFETTTLTRANFCALKGMKEAALEALLVQARDERKLAPPPPPQERERELERQRQRPVERDRDRPPQGQRRDDRGPRSGPRSGPHSGRPPR